MRQWLLAFFFVAGLANVGLAAKPKSASATGSAKGKAAVEVEAKIETKKDKKKVTRKSTKATKKNKGKVSKNKKSKKSLKASSQSSKSKKVAKKKVAKKKSSKKAPVKAAKAESKWNHACTELLDTSVDSTLKLEKSLSRRKKKLSPEEFEGQVQNEMLVVQLNAWVCAISSQFDDNQKGASIEEEFLKDYAQRVQSRNL